MSRCWSHFSALESPPSYPGSEPRPVTALSVEQVRQVQAFLWTSGHALPIAHLSSQQALTLMDQCSVMGGQRQLLGFTEQTAGLCRVSIRLGLVEDAEPQLRACQADR